MSRIFNHLLVAALFVSIGSFLALQQASAQAPRISLPRVTVNVPAIHVPTPVRPDVSPKIRTAPAQQGLLNAAPQPLNKASSGQEREGAVITRVQINNITQHISAVTSQILKVEIQLKTLESQVPEQGQYRGTAQYQNAVQNWKHLTASLNDELSVLYKQLQSYNAQLQQLRSFKPA